MVECGVDSVYLGLLDFRNTYYKYTCTFVNLSYLILRKLILDINFISLVEWFFSAKFLFRDIAKKGHKNCLETNVEKLCSNQFVNICQSFQTYKIKQKPNWRIETAMTKILFKFVIEKVFFFKRIQHRTNINMNVFFNSVVHF